MLMLCISRLRRRVNRHCAHRGRLTRRETALQVLEVAPLLYNQLEYLFGADDPLRAMARRVS